MPQRSASAPRATEDRRDEFRPGERKPPHPRAARRAAPRNALAHFEAHSVLLFALLTGTALLAPPRLVRAQSVAPAARTEAPAATAGLAAASPARGTIEAAFARADSNQDGSLSREEAARFSALAAQFDTMDTDRDQKLSLPEFVRAVIAR